MVSSKLPSRERLKACGEVGSEEKERERVEGSGKRIDGFEQIGEEDKCEMKRKERKDLRFEAESFRAINIFLLFFTSQGLGFMLMRSY